MVVKFPQPTEAELEAEKLYWIGLNPFWWHIVQGKISEITKSYLWENFTEEIEQAIEAMMLSQEAELQIEASQIAALGVVAYRTANLAIFNVFDTAIPFTSQEPNSDGTLHSTVTNPSRFTATTEGWHEAKCRLTFAPNATGYRQITLRKSGSVEDIEQKSALPATINSPVMLNKKIYMLAGDYLEWWAIQSSGNTLNLLGQRHLTWASLFFVGK